MIFDWSSLREKCVEEVAWELASSRLPVTHNNDPPETRLARWNALAEEAKSEAEDAINAMNNIRLLDLLSNIIRKETTP